MRDKKNVITIIIFAVVIIVILALGIFSVISLITRKNVDSSIVDKYNKEIYVSTTLPDIQGNDNIIRDEFGKKSNTSENALNDKKWMNLDFTDFNIYSINGVTSIISFSIRNNTNMVIESDKFQFQLKDNNGSIVSIIDFDEVVLPSTGIIKVTVDINGDISNVKEIIIDNINYTMQINEVK